MKFVKNTSTRLAGCVLMLLLGYAIGGTVGLPSSAEAEVREVTPPAAFKSGGARSEVVLKQIAATLRQMDTRLANVEKSARELVRLQNE